MSLIARHAFLGARIIDCDTRITLGMARALCHDPHLPINGVARYVGLPGNAPGEDLTTAEVTDITSCGLGLIVVQHVRMPGWRPEEHDGGADGACAGRLALQAGVPAGTTLACDLEGVDPNEPDVLTSRWANQWYAAVVAAGYDPCLYVGYDTGLSGAQLYALPFHCYWRSFSQVPDVPGRGYRLVQLGTTTIAGVECDVDVVQRDYRGELPRWAEAA